MYSKFRRLEKGCVRVMFADVIFDSPSKDLDNGFKTINLVFELPPVPDPEPRLLPVLVNTNSVVSSTPATTRLISITFDLP